MYQSRQPERAARKEEEEGWLEQVLSAVAEGKGRGRQFGEDGKGSREERRTGILVQERPHQQFQGEREGESDRRSGWIGDLDQRGIQPPLPVIQGEWPVAREIPLRQRTMAQGPL